MMATEHEFVTALLSRLPVDVVEGMRKDIKANQMAFGRNLYEWGPQRQCKRL